MKELSQFLMVDKTTTSKVVQKLITEKLVRKNQDTQDKRVYQLFPTAKAKLAYTIIIEEENRLTSQCHTDLNKVQQETVLTLIQKMRKNIADDWYTLKRYR
jgi:DNA-binding MarR family transcriptional regulator